MFLDEYIHTDSKADIPFLRNVDFLKLSSLLDYNLHYCFAYFISQDSLILKSIVARHSQIEEKIDALVYAIEEDPLSFNDDSSKLHLSLLTEFKILNKLLTDTIKIRALHDQEQDEPTHLFQDLCDSFSKIFKGLIDAYMQKSAQIASQMIQQSTDIITNLYNIEIHTNSNISAHFGSIHQILHKILNLIATHYDKNTQI